MYVLVAVASRHGSSLEIGEVIAATLRTQSLEADVQRVDDVVSLEPYAAVVLGSSVYAGHWLRRARLFVDTFEAELLRRPLWLFSSGPVGDPPKPLDNPAEVATLTKRLGSRSHRLFGGRIEGDQLGIAEKALVTLVRAPYGDFRPWSEISVWAEAIAADLTAGTLDSAWAGPPTSLPVA
jgi:menaquinone-dependent protoporphyrinogen oxidase